MNSRVYAQYLRQCRRQFHGRSTSSLERKHRLRPFSTSRQTHDENNQSATKQLDSVYDDLTSSSSLPSTSPPPEPSTSSSDDLVAKARIVFGSRMAGPAERAAELTSKSRLIAGVLVPPKPEEPDNCCMSGCVNCVWDRYQEEIDDWAAKSAEAKAKMNSPGNAGETSSRGGMRGGGTGVTTAAEVPTHVMSSMDEDGGGSEGLWDNAAAGPGRDGGLLESGSNMEDMFEDIPVGIREFMKNERRMRERKKLAAADAVSP